MLAQEVAHKYARALFDSVRSHQTVDAVYGQMDGLKEVVEGDDQLVRFLKSPKVTQKDKRDLLHSALSERVDRVVLEFLDLLVDKKRIAFLPEIIDEFDRMVEAAKGIARVTVITAVALNDTERAAMGEKMQAKTKLEVILEERVDPRIIGGVIAIFHDQIIDGSVRYRLELVEDRLSRARVR